MRQKVVITGIGVVSPLGGDLPTFRTHLLQGKSAAGPLTLFPPASLPTKIVAQVHEALPYPTQDRKSSFAFMAAERALQDAEQSSTPLRQFYQTSGQLSIGIGLELFSMPDMIQKLQPHFVSSETDPTSFLQTPSDQTVHQLCAKFQLTQPPLVHISACAASTDALGMSLQILRRKPNHWILAGGTDSMINPMGIGGFCAIKAMTTRNDEPQKASRPFDRDRDGFLLGEGSAFFVLETETQAQKRGAFIYAELCGYGNSFDAYGISEPHPEGEGALLAMQRALSSAQIGPEELVYINAHGTSTPKNDAVESKAIQKLLGTHFDQVWVSSTKSMIGHLISSAGAVETAAVLACAREGQMHPSINVDHQDSACPLRLVQPQAQPLPHGYILKNSFAFGGQNTALVFKMR